MRHVQASQRALSMEPAGTVVDSETAFDPRFINLDASISVENLLGALRRTGRAGLLFHGPSGSGKTQLANHLAQQLDREMLYRTGSDLLNKYVGGTEQRIAKLFRSCDVEREIIFWMKQKACSAAARARNAPGRSRRSMSSCGRLSSWRRAYSLLRPTMSIAWMPR